MATVVKSMNQLAKVLLESQIQKALKMTQKAVSECVQESINEYYKEKVFRGGTSAIPNVYDRTYHLLNSLVKTEVIKTGNTLSCQVKIDEDYLNYQYPGTYGCDGIPATGRDVLTWNNEYGSHGGTVNGDWKIWEKAIAAIGGNAGIKAIFISNLRKCGVPIK